MELHDEDFCDFMLALLHIKPLLKGVHSKNEQILFLLKVDLFSEGALKNDSRFP